jgi:hypothetical protein
VYLTKNLINELIDFNKIYARSEEARKSYEKIENADGTPFN